MNSYHEDWLEDYLNSMYPDTPDGDDAPPIVLMRHSEEPSE